MIKKKLNDMSFLDHLEELRWRIIKCLVSIIIGAVLCYWKADLLFAFLLKPIQNIDPKPQLIYLKPAGMFLVKMTVTFVSGLILSLPIIFYQAWAFVVPGLYDNEKKFAILFIFSTVLCFSIGFFFAYFLIIPLGLNFFIGMSVEDVIPQIDINEYISFVVRIIMVFGVVFELPIIAAALAKMGFINSRLLVKIRPYAIIVTFILGAVLTPPDPISQILMALPLILLYEISIIITRMIGKNE